LRGCIGGVVFVVSVAVPIAVEALVYEKEVTSSLMWLTDPKRSKWTTGRLREALKHEDKIRIEQALTMAAYREMGGVLYTRLRHK
jgi:hypothetical protein